MTFTTKYASIESVHTINSHRRTAPTEAIVNIQSVLNISTQDSLVITWFLISWMVGFIFYFRKRRILSPYADIPMPVPFEQIQSFERTDSAALTTWAIMSIMSGGIVIWLNHENASLWAQILPWIGFFTQLSMSCVITKEDKIVLDIGILILKKEVRLTALQKIMSIMKSKGEGKNDLILMDPKEELYIDDAGAIYRNAFRILEQLHPNKGQWDVYLSHDAPGKRKVFLKEVIDETWGVLEHYWNNYRSNSEHGEKALIEILNSPIYSNSQVTAIIRMLKEAQKKMPSPKRFMNDILAEGLVNRDLILAGLIQDILDGKDPDS